MKKITRQENAKRILYSIVVLTLCSVTLFAFWKQSDSNKDFIPETGTHSMPTDEKTQKAALKPKLTDDQKAFVNSFQTF